MAAALAVVAIGVGHLLVPSVDGPEYTVLVGAVAIAVWYGGFGPGLLTVVVGWSLSPVFMSETPDLSLAEQDETRWAISLAVGLIVVWFSLVLRRARERADTAVVVAEQSTRQMEAIQELTTALSAALKPSDVARELVTRMPRLMGARRGALGLIEGDELVIVDPVGDAPQSFEPGLRLPLSAKTALTRAAAEGTLKQARDRATLEREFADGLVLTPEAQAVVAVPLLAEGRVVGAINFLYEDAQAVHEEAAAIAAIAADLGGQAFERSRLYEREQQWRKGLDRILRIAPRLYVGSTEEISLEICREARRTLGADITEIWLVDDEWVWLDLVCRDPDSDTLSKDDRLEVGQLPGLREAIESLEVTFVPDAEEALSGDLLEYVRKVGIKSWLWAPIAIGGRAERVLFFSWDSVLHEPDPSLRLLARRFADHAGLALEQLERREAEELAAEHALETRRLLDSTAALAAAATPAAVTNAILSEGRRSLGATSGVVMSLTPAGHELELVDSQGLEPGTHDDWASLPIDADAPLALSARDDVLLAIESPNELADRFPGLTAPSAKTTGAFLALPLSAAGSVRGAIGLAFASPQTFSDAELEYARALARQGAQALERAQLLAAEFAARTRAEDLVVLASALSEAVGPSDVVRALRSQLFGRSDAIAVGVYVLGRTGVDLQLVDPDESELGSRTALRRLSLDSSSPPVESARERRSVWIGTEEEWAQFGDTEAWRSGAGVQSLGAVPLIAESRLVGVLVVGYELEGAVEEDVRELVESIGPRAGHALERASLLEREQSARVSAETASRRTRRLQSITQALAAAPASREVAEIVVGEAAAAVSADVAVLFAFAARDEPEVLAAIGVERSPSDELAAAVAEASQRGSLVVVDGEQGADLGAHRLQAAAGQFGFRGAACVPLGVGARFLAALFVGYREQVRLAAEDTALLQTIARIGAQALERSRLFDEEQQLRQRAERIQLLTEALSGSLSQRDVAEVAVDALVLGAGADRAALSIVLEDRQVQRKLAWRGYLPEAQETWLEIPLHVRTPGNRALTTERIVFYETLDELAGDFPEAAARMRVTGHESFLFIPLVSGGRRNGLVITSFAEPTTLDDEDRAFVETLASLVAQALDRARSFESERTIAETLQRSVLPVSLPTVANVQLAARYLPGTEEVDVGGDWFDAILLPTGRLGLVVGDVVGKGVQSAATMAQLRNALRAFALDQMKPSSTMSRLNRLTEQISESAFATIVYAVLDPDAGICRFTSAGHPPPLVILPDGSANFVEGGRGLPLGTGANVRYRQEAVELPVGSTIVFYTDGLVERRSEPIDEGLERLRQAAQESPGNPEHLVEHLLQALVGEEGRRDDIALLAVRLLAVPPKPLDLDLPSAPQSLDLVRDLLRTWLERAPVTEEESHDIVLATWEACANAIEHADEKSDRPSFAVRAELEDSTVLVTVTDRGRWHEPADRVDRGLGIRLIRAVMSSVEIDSGEAGTRVRLEKVLAGDGAPAQ